MNQGRYETKEAERHGTITTRQSLLAKQRHDVEDVTDEQFRNALEIVKDRLRRKSGRYFVVK